MAVTAGKQKTRLDFSTLVEDAVPPTMARTKDKIEENPAAPTKETATKVSQPVEAHVENPKVSTSPKKQKKDPAPHDAATDDIDALLSTMATGRGVQKSVYLDEDVYKYIQDKCKKTNVKFSTVLNLLVRSAIKQQEKK